MANLRKTVLAALAGTTLACSALAQGAGPDGARPTPAQREAKARAYFTDTPLQVHDGRTLKFFTDVLKDQLVLINFVFTECSAACPLITQKLLQARQLLGPLARDVRFVSISVDPEGDTPQALQAFAAKQGALDPAWLWLTGTRPNVELVTKRLGAYSDDKETHFTGLIVGNLRTDRWVKIRPDATPAVIALQLRTVGELGGAQAPTPGPPRGR